MPSTTEPVREALLSRDETYTDGAYRCRLFDPAKPWASIRVLIEADGRISWADPRDWSTLVDWSIAGKLARRCYGPATYGHVDLYLI